MVLSRWRFSLSEVERMLAVIALGFQGAAASLVTSGSVRTPSRSGAVSVHMKVADDLGIPCEGECSLPSFPKMPASVHPGVVTGKALVDLLEHAKKNGYAIPAVNW